MGDVVALEDQRPHAMCLDPLTGNAHVLPVSLLEDYMKGEAVLDEEILRAMVKYFIEDN